VLISSETMGDPNSLGELHGIDHPEGIAAIRQGNLKHT